MHDRIRRCISYTVAPVTKYELSDLLRFRGNGSCARQTNCDRIDGNTLEVETTQALLGVR